MSAHDGQGRWCACGVEVPERGMVTGAYLGGQFLQGLIGDTHNGPVSLAHLSFQACHRGPEWLASPLAQRPAEGERRGGDADIKLATGTTWCFTGVCSADSCVREHLSRTHSCRSGFSEVWLVGRPRWSGWRGVCGVGLLVGV